MISWAQLAVLALVLVVALVVAIWIPLLLWLREVRRIFDASKLQADSIDGALSAYNGRLRVVEDVRLPKVEGRLDELSGRVWALEQRPALASPALSLPARAKP